MSSCAITDHGNMHGIIEFYKAMKKEELKPIIGVEAYVTMDPDGLDKAEMVRDNYHIVILAMNKIGYQNLIWLISNANLNNFYYKPRIYWETLLEKNEGLIITTACLGGITAKSAKILPDNIIQILGGEYNETSKKFEDTLNCIKPRLLTLKETFVDRLYIELQDHEMWEQKAYNLWAQRTAWDLDIPMVITCDAHYLRARDYNTHALIIAKQMKQTIEEYKASGVMFYDEKCFIRSPEDMYKVAEKMGSPEAAENTMVISDQCNVEITLGKYENPKFNITECDDYEEFLKWKRGKHE